MIRLIRIKHSDPLIRPCVIAMGYVTASATYYSLLGDCIGLIICFTSDKKPIDLEGYYKQKIEHGNDSEGKKVATKLSKAYYNNHY